MTGTSAANSAPRTTAHSASQKPAPRAGAAKRPNAPSTAPGARLLAAVSQRAKRIIRKLLLGRTAGLRSAVWRLPAVRF